MNLTTCMGNGQRLIGLVLVGLLCGTPLGSAQTTPDNPLRQDCSQGASATSPVRKASAVEPLAAGRRPVTRSASSSGATARTVSYGFNAARHQIPGYVPRHEMVSGVPMQQAEVVEAPPMLQEGEMMLEPLPGEGAIYEGEMYEGDCCSDMDPCGSCTTCNGCLIPCPVFSLRNFEFLGGVQGFTAAPNLGRAGSFGFHYGVNWAAPVPCTPRGELGMQLGYRGVSSNYSGSGLTPDARHQSFLTGGLFRRVDWGLQGAVAFDYLADDWYYQSHLTQLRAELSWVYPECHELGFWTSLHLTDDTVQTVTQQNGQLVQSQLTFEPLDLYAFFYRRRFESIGGGYGRMFAGFTGQSDGLIGADIKVPLTENWALQSGFTYVIPDESNKQIAYLEEAWNVGISVIWYPGERKSVGNDYYRPLLDVADNGNFIPMIK